MTIQWFNTEQYPTVFLGNSEASKEYKEQLYKQFVSQFGFDKVAAYERVKNLTYLLEGKQGYNSGKEYDTPPALPCFLDHAMYFRNTKLDTTIVVSHPYQFDLELMSEFLNQLNLESIVWFNDKSFYMTKSTPTIMIGAQEKLENLNMNANNRIWQCS
ncbi:hypothetical protein [Vagococcus humatus]|nr:hypothetical protein [Vagococcus humatus]